MSDFSHLGNNVTSNFQKFTANSRSNGESWYAWKKPRGCNFIQFLGLGGGGGGGTGGETIYFTYTGGVGNKYQEAPGGGGAGGGSAAPALLMYPAWALPDTIYISVGYGGAGGDGSVRTVGIYQLDAQQNISSPGSTGTNTYISLNATTATETCLLISNAGNGGSGGLGGYGSSNYGSGSAAGAPGVGYAGSGGAANLSTEVGMSPYSYSPIVNSGGQSSSMGNFGGNISIYNSSVSGGQTGASAYPGATAPWGIITSGGSGGGGAAFSYTDASGNPYTTSSPYGGAGGTIRYYQGLVSSDLSLAGTPATTDTVFAGINGANGLQPIPDLFAFTGGFGGSGGGLDKSTRYTIPGFLPSGLYTGTVYKGGQGGKGSYGSGGGGGGGGQSVYLSVTAKGGMAKGGDGGDGLVIIVTW